VTCVDIGCGFSAELVDEFCCVGNTLGLNGDADAALTARIQSSWFKFPSLIPFLTKLCGKVYSECGMHELAVYCMGVKHGQ